MQKSGGLLQTRIRSFPAELDARGSRHNAGIDLLRILSMFYIVIVHTISKGWGGLIEAAQPGSIQFALCTLMRTLTLAGVDVFALISGFVGYSDERRSVRTIGLTRLYLQVVTCGVFASLVTFALHAGSVSVKDFVTPFFPITCDLYWYYTAYVGLFLVMPALNAGLRHTPNRILRMMFLAMFAAFSIYTCVFDRFKLESGYAMIWLILLYILGGIMKKCEVGKRIKPWMAFAGVAVLTAFAWLWKLFGPKIGAFGLEIDRDLLSRYTSPTMLGAAMLYVIGFSKLRCGRFLTRFAAFASPCVFAVYLLNANSLIRQWLIVGRFARLAAASPLVLVGTILGFAVCFTAVSILLDRVRLQVFALLRIPKLLAAIDSLAHKLARKWIPNG